MDKLIKYVHNKVGELGKQILDGEIDINPYMKVTAAGGLSNGRTPCTYCDYNDICGFDGKVKGCEYRKLINKKDEEVWKLLRKEVYAGEGDSEDNVEAEIVPEDKEVRESTENMKERVLSEGGEKDGEMD